ncbi:hypothetical protein BGX38DRAFT_1143033 [Terfezia claveryi]|nr:hypothetical protein BGX38DRAFT_1143033 [Terfezia claveryi]
MLTTFRILHIFSFSLFLVPTRLLFLMHFTRTNRPLTNWYVLGVLNRSKAFTRLTGVQLGQSPLQTPACWNPLRRITEKPRGTIRSESPSTPACWNPLLRITEKPGVFDRLRTSTGLTGVQLGQSPLKLQLAGILFGELQRSSRVKL